jgi:iron-sulfur cluster assembly protein
MIELTDAAILKAAEKAETDGRSTISLGITGGGCSGYEYVIKWADNGPLLGSITDYGKFQIYIEQGSESYLMGSTLDWVKQGLNESFMIVNPNEEATCGCGISILFDQDKINTNEALLMETA